MPPKVNLSAGSYSSVDGLFVEASMPESLEEDFILHLKLEVNITWVHNSFRECTMSKHMFIGTDPETGESVFAVNTVDIYVFLFNGCINSAGNDYAQKTPRVHWTMGTDLYAEDQFYAQFDISGAAQESDEYKVKSFFYWKRNSIF